LVLKETKKNEKGENKTVYEGISLISGEIINNYTLQHSTELERMNYLQHEKKNPETREMNPLT